MARITKKLLKYAGSIGIDKKLLDTAQILPSEKVQVVNVNNGARFETYAIAEKANSGTIALYGPAARLGEVDDVVVILSYGAAEPSEAKKHTIRVVHVDKNNKVVKCCP